MISLSDYERGRSYDGRYDHDLAGLQRRLVVIQAAHIVHGRRAIVMFEGWDAAGKGGIIQRLTAKWDPRYFEVWPIAAPTNAEKAHDFLWRFRERMPGAGEIAVFDRSWYGRVLVERVEGFATAAEWQAGYGAIDDFEAELDRAGVTLVKLFVHITQATQDRRILKRLTHPWKRWKTGLDDFRNRARRADYLLAMRDMFDRTDTLHARWHVVDGNDKKAARIAALSHIVARLEAAVPLDPPPLDPAVKAVAEQALGVPL